MLLAKTVPLLLLVVVVFRLLGMLDKQAAVMC
jgi:hypothetical protein